MAQSNRAIRDDRDRKNSIRLRSIKSDFNAGNIKSIRQMFDIVAESWFAQKMNMGFTTLRSKSISPGEFTINEVKRMADLLDVNFEKFLEFVVSLSLRTKKYTKK